ncbi:MAG: toxin-antitoxin system TumE family protein [Candidatus Hodarchaeales archaeon]
MYRTLRLLKTHKFIAKYEFLDFKKGSDFYYLKVKCEIVGRSFLFIREYVSENEYLYSYHWQDEAGKLLIRWDNAPHHKTLKTYPHHKHTPKIEESTEVTLEDVLDQINKELQKS